MTSRLTVGTTIFDTLLTQLHGLSDLEVVQIGGDWHLYAASEADGALTSFSLSTPTAPVLISEISYSLLSETGTLSDVVTYEAGGETHALTLGRYEDAVGVYDLTSGGGMTKALSLDDGGATFDRGLVGEAITTANGTFIYTAAFGASGFQMFQVGLGGTLSSFGDVSDNAARYLGDVTALEGVFLHGKHFLFAASALDTGVHAYEVATNGTLTETAAVGAGDGSGFNGVTELASVEMGARSFVIMGAAETDSLTVYRVSQGGKLKEVDHVLDTLDSRFQGVTSVKVVEGTDQTFVLAGGSDAGLTVFEMTKRGKLNLLETITDEFTTALDDISDIEALMDGDTATLFVSSSTEHGLTTLTLDLARGGQLIEGGAVADILTGTSGDDEIWGMGRSDVLFGEDGNDRLIDGRGRDEMTGGAGADIFEFVNDGRTDWVMDFELGTDRLDVTGYDGIYHISSLDIQARAAGAVIFVQGDIIRLQNPDGGPFDVSLFTQDDFIFG